MRRGVGSTPVPSGSPEESPATSFAVTLFFPLFSLADRGTALSVAHARRQEPAWAASRLGSARARVVGRRVLRAGPAVE